FREKNQRSEKRISVQRKESAFNFSPLGFDFPMVRFYFGSSVRLLLSWVRLWSRSVRLSDGSVLLFSSLG
ncbi:hypothetical protein NOM01_16405, partial [Sporolactobacillus sp. STSJ-5]|uniref:hypothetical protein n=1 Tax=Sporolactobacillus sp. STSJ-5 TaxID=2965076 RepID=UPI0021058B09